MITGTEELRVAVDDLSEPDAIADRRITERAISNDTVANFRLGLFIGSIVLEIPEVYESASRLLQ